MSESLFSLVGEYKELYALLTEAEEDEEQVVEDTIEGVLGEITVKSEGYLALINRLDMELDACRKHRDEWAYRVKVRENGIKRLKDRLAAGMQMMDKKELKAGDNTIKLVNNGGQLPLKYFNGMMSDIPQDKVDIQNVPKEYRKTVVTETIDTEKIRKDLDAGKKLDFVEYGNRGVHVRIK